MRIDVVNGPNLNLLGTREPAIYGRTTLAELEAKLVGIGRTLTIDVECFQSNHEGALIDRVQEAASAGTCGIVINPAGLTHTSVALRDALLSVGVPFVEVHISNVYAREEFRHGSLLRDAAVGSVVGLGVRGYEYALRALVSRAKSSG